LRAISKPPWVRIASLDSIEYLMASSIADLAMKVLEMSKMRICVESSMDISGRATAKPTPDQDPRRQRR
jgi:aspartokinase